jgi:hypothetical protein
MAIGKKGVKVEHCSQDVAPDAHNCSPDVMDSSDEPARLGENTNHFVKANLSERAPGCLHLADDPLCDQTGSRCVLRRCSCMPETRDEKRRPELLFHALEFGYWVVVYPEFEDEKVEIRGGYR